MDVLPDVEIWYSQPDYDASQRWQLPANYWNTYPLDALNKYEQQDVAKACASDFYSNHDGWEATWPLVFALYYSEDGPEVMRFEAECEYEPTFSARAIPPDPQQEQP